MRKRPHAVTDAVTTVAIVARPGRSSASVRWDPWRQAWSVSCRAPATGGRANEEIAELLAGRLGVGRPALRWLSGSRAARKRLEVEGLTAAEVAARLGAPVGREETASAPGSD